MLLDPRFVRCMFYMLFLVHDLEFLACDVPSLAEFYLPLHQVSKIVGKLGLKIPRRHLEDWPRPSITRPPLRLILVH